MNTPTFERLAKFVDALNANPLGSGIASLFDAAIQLRWVSHPLDGKETAEFGGSSGSWACIDTTEGRARLLDGDHRNDYDWRMCVLVETDDVALQSILRGDVTPLDAFLTDRLHVSHFTIGGAMGQWALAFLAFGQRASSARVIVPARKEKRFMTYRYHAAAENRRTELLRRSQT